MPYDSIDRSRFWEIQEVDEIIPTWVQEQGMLISDKIGCVVTVVLIDRSHFQLPISQGGNSGLRDDDPGLWRKGALVEGDIKVKRPERQNVEHRLLARCSLGQRHGEHNETDEALGDMYSQRPTSLHDCHSHLEKTDCVVHNR